MDLKVTNVHLMDYGLNKWTSVSTIFLACVPGV